MKNIEKTIKNLLNPSEKFPFYEIKYQSSKSFFCKLEFSNENFHNSTVKISLFQKNQPIDCFFNWNSQKSESDFDEFSNNSNTFDFSAKYINKIIKLNIIPKQDLSQLIIIHIGPVQLDPLLRSTLQNILYFGTSNTMPVQIGKDLQQGSLLINSKEIILKDYSGDLIVLKNHFSQIKLDFSEKKGPVSEKQFFLVFKKESIIKGEYTEGGICLTCDSKAQRDLLFLIQQVLSAKQFLIDEKVIDSINEEKNVEDFGQFVGLLLRYSGNKEVVGQMEMLVRKGIEERNQLKEKIVEMEEEYEVVIETFKEILKQQGVSCFESVYYQSKSGGYKKIQSELEEKNGLLEEKVRNLQEELKIYQYSTGFDRNEEEIEKKFNRKLMKIYQENEEKIEKLNFEISEQVLLIKYLQSQNDFLQKKNEEFEQTKQEISVFISKINAKSTEKSQYLSQILNFKPENKIFPQNKTKIFDLTPLRSRKNYILTEENEKSRHTQRNSNKENQYLNISQNKKY